MRVYEQIYAHLYYVFFFFSSLCRTLTLRFRVFLLPCPFPRALYSPLCPTAGTFLFFESLHTCSYSSTS